MQTPKGSGLLYQLFFWLGAAGLCLAVATDALAVAGRHLGLPVLGSIEVMQVAIVLLASAAMLIATLQGEHASIHIVTDRLSTRSAATFKRVAAAISIYFCLLLAFGSVWVFHDTLGGHERSEILHIPFVLLRLMAVITPLFMAAYLTKQWWGSKHHEP